MLVVANALYLVALLAYGTTAVAGLLGRTLRRPRWADFAFGTLAVGSVAHTAVVALHGLSTGRLALGQAAAGPWDHPFASLGWLIGVVAVAVGAWQQPARPVSGILSPVIAALAFLALLVEDVGATRSLLPGLLDSVWVHVHTVATYTSFALFALAFGSGILYLQADAMLRSKKLPVAGSPLPSLVLLDRINERAFSGGLAGLTVGMVAGTFWALTGAEAMDVRAKGVATLCLWLVYATGWQARYVLGWGGRRAAWFAIVGFAGLVVIIVGVAHG